MVHCVTLSFDALYRLTVCVRVCVCGVYVFVCAGAAAPYTHWKQTVFYLLDTFPVCKGEEVLTRCREWSVELADARMQIYITCTHTHAWVPQHACAHVLSMRPMDG